ncbi:hypothetical protein D3C73_645190 [compost metagenome]
MRHDLVDLVIGIGDRIGVGFLAETLMAEADFVERRGGRAVHVVAHEIEDGPGGEAFQRQQCLGARLLTHSGNPFHVLEQLGLVDEVVGSLQHFA